MKGHKFIIYERSPPSPFSVEFLPSFFFFVIEDVSEPKESLYSESRSPETLFKNTKNFDNLFKRIKISEDEDSLINELFQEKYQKFKG